MRIGIELVDEQRRPRPSAVAGMARAAERLGYATVWVRHGGDAIATAEHLAVAAGATDRVAVGVEVTSPPLDAVVAALEDRAALFADRLHLAVPAGITAADVDRLRAMATTTLLVDPSVDIAAFADDVAGYFVGDPSRSIPVLTLEGFEVVVRLPVHSDTPSGALEQLQQVRTAGVDEVVHAAADETDIDRAMATYAALAEAVEQAV
jgi:hypothetical protein